MSFLDEYRRTHTHPINKATHTVGIPMIVVSLPLFFFHWEWALGLFVGGWILQFIGHAFEGKPPAFFKNPLFLIVGLVWWVKKILGLEKKSESL